MRDCILFDMDGVLIDSEYCMRLSAINALREYGYEVEHADFMPFTGMGEDRFIGGVVEAHGGIYSPEMKRRAYELYGELAAENVVVFEGIRELVLTLKQKGYHLAVASAADLVKVKINLSCIGLTVEDFDAVVTGSDIVHKKPDPEIFLTAAARIGADPSRCVVVEDAISGVQAGVAAGAKVIGVTSTFDAQTLQQAGASFTVAHTPEILELLPRL